MDNSQNASAGAMKGHAEEQSKSMMERAQDVAHSAAESIQSAAHQASESAQEAGQHMQMKRDETMDSAKNATH